MSILDEPRRLVAARSIIRIVVRARRACESTNREVRSRLDFKSDSRPLRRPVS